MNIGIVAVSSRFAVETAEAIRAWMAEHYPAGEPKLVFHPSVHDKHGHFAGDDATRAQAFIDVANDPRIDAVWFARGGYGACRMAEAVLPHMTPVARKKRYLGYSDAGSLLAALYRHGFEHVAHGPMASDARRSPETGRRAVDWLVAGAETSLEPSLLSDPRPAAAFNITILSQLLGTPIEPDLSGHVLMLEEVSEAAYRIDRYMFHITSQPQMRRLAGIRMGRASDITPNEPDFGMTAEEIVRFWCDRAGIPYLGAADIGHDAANKVVPFGAR